VRGLRDAELRAAKVIAENIRSRLASYFSVAAWPIAAHVTDAPTVASSGGSRYEGGQIFLSLWYTA
jgi:hypothetical protein